MLRSGWSINLFYDHHFCTGSAFSEVALVIKHGYWEAASSLMSVSWNLKITLVCDAAVSRQCLILAP